MGSRAVLSDAEIADALRALPAWSCDGGKIVRKITAPSFRAAQRLVNRICDAAEGANHHPDLSWTWAHVTIALHTHDAGGITRKDTNLAAVIDDILADG
jgi:4a-hydroxytetrahydrobiopterin dehydratase